jgi:hypothetical protein
MKIYKTIIWGILFVLLVNIVRKCKVSKSNAKIETYASAKEIIPGVWLSTEPLYDEHIKNYEVLLFKNDGSIKYGQGVTSELALKFANEDKAGKWSVVEKPDLLNSLINDQRFLIEFKNDAFGSELFRVEIDPKQHRMGRPTNESDKNNIRYGLIYIGGKIFYKQ